MVKNSLFVLVSFFLILVSCSQDENLNETNDSFQMNQEPLTARQVNDIINSFNSNGTKFYWKNVTIHTLWSAIKIGNNLATVGYGTSSTDFEKSNTSTHQSQQQNLLQLISKSEEKSISEILVYQSEHLKLFDIKITKPQTLELLRKNKNVRYVEPADYKYFSYENSGISDEYQVFSSSGCGYSSATLSSLDFTTVTPNARVPWSFYRHNIPAAWNLTSGSGVGIGIVDTGLSPQQSLMNGSFNSGLSTGRYVQKYGTYVDSIWPWSTTTDGVNDLCSHGTSMASVATAPRNSVGLPVGVAYNSNLISYRASSDVVLNGYHEQRGVEQAFTALGNRTDVKIISMSMGHIFSVGRIEDGVRYANNRGKLIFCAGGTSTSFTNFVGVIFPAWMPETVAVTGIKEASTYQKCDVCHTGSEIDFTIMMQRAGSNNTVPVLSYYNNQADYVGGSSVATATTAGIAALVWAKNPTWTKSQVLTKMKQASQFYPTKNSQFGHGIINALTAVQ